MMKQIKEIAETRVRCYRRTRVLLRREGRGGNAKRAWRLYRETGPQLRNNTQAASAGEASRGDVPANELWAIDQSFDGQKMPPKGLPLVWAARFSKGSRSN
jgi:hypothetical protein